MVKSRRCHNASKQLKRMYFKGNCMNEQQHEQIFKFIEDLVIQYNIPNAGWKTTTTWKSLQIKGSKTRSIYVRLSYVKGWDLSINIPDSVTCSAFCQARKSDLFDCTINTGTNIKRINIMFTDRGWNNLYQSLLLLERDILLSLWLRKEPLRSNDSILGSCSKGNVCSNCTISSLQETVQSDVEPEIKLELEVNIDLDENNAEMRPFDPYALIQDTLGRDCGDNCRCQKDDFNEKSHYHTWRRQRDNGELYEKKGTVFVGGNGQYIKINLCKNCISVCLDEFDQADIEARRDPDNPNLRVVIPTVKELSKEQVHLIERWLLRALGEANDCQC